MEKIMIYPHFVIFVIMLLSAFTFYMIPVHNIEQTDSPLIKSILFLVVALKTPFHLGIFVLAFAIFLIFDIERNIKNILIGTAVSILIYTLSHFSLWLAGLYLSSLIMYLFFYSYATKVKYDRVHKYVEEVDRIGFLTTWNRRKFKPTLKQYDVYFDKAMRNAQAESLYTAMDYNYKVNSYQVPKEELYDKNFKEKSKQREYSDEERDILKQIANSEGKLIYMALGLIICVCSGIAYILFFSWWIALHKMYQREDVGITHILGMILLTAFDFLVVLILSQYDIYMALIKFIAISISIYMVQFYLYKTDCSYEIDLDYDEKINIIGGGDDIRRVVISFMTGKEFLVNVILSSLIVSIINPKIYIFSDSVLFSYINMFLGSFLVN